MKHRISLWYKKKKKSETVLWRFHSAVCTLACSKNFKICIAMVCTPKRKQLSFGPCTRPNYSNLFLHTGERFQGWWCTAGVFTSFLWLVNIEQRKEEEGREVREDRIAACEGRREVIGMGDWEEGRGEKRVVRDGRRYVRRRFTEFIQSVSRGSLSLLWLI